jgi:Ca2+-binding EF-hand superfamily protein
MCPDVAISGDGMRGAWRVKGQTGRNATQRQEKDMTTPTKTAVAALALFGVVLASAALAEKGPGGPGGRGAMLLEQFDAIDTDKDGKLSLAELEAHRKAEFAAADTNGDAALSPEELSARQLARFNETLADRTARMIDNMDSDGNGSLSVDEIGEGPGERHFARIDRDNDGTISKEEAEAALKRVRGRDHGGNMDGN